MTNLQRFLANEPGLSTMGVREEIVGLMRDVGVMVERLREANSELLEHGVTDYELQETLSLAQKYEWFKEVV
jgi:hypothetical protein